MAVSTNAGQQPVTAHSSEENKFAFAVKQIIKSSVITAKMVKVTAVSNDGGVSPVGTVSIQPLVKQMDGQGNTQAHGTISNIPYSRLQGGSNAIIIDPKVGDIGLAIFCDSDSSAVKSTKKQSAPGSFRRYDYSDGVYLFTILSGTPTQIIQFTDSGINAVDVNGNTIKMESNGINLNGVIIDRNGNIKAPGDVMANAQAAFVSLLLHLHSAVQIGSSDSGPPVAST